MCQDPVQLFTLMKLQKNYGEEDFNENKRCKWELEEQYREVKELEEMSENDPKS